MQDFEKLGAFYLGKGYDLETSALRDEPFLYDAKDLTTHAVCVGMTGSGKTGLCLALLEEAAIDGIPAIAIDPKGDLGNLLLAFPELSPAEFRPWIDEGAATRAGMTPDQFAASQAKLWREGLAEWGETPERVARFRDAAEAVIYTPGSNAGVPLSVLGSFAAPPAAVVADSDAMGQRVGSAASGLLALLGVTGDPLQSREHILISNILDKAWRDGKNIDLPSLIREIQSPPFEKIGILDLESFFSAKDRVAFSLRINNLLASPSFAGWMEGEPLDIKRLLYAPDGRPRLSILSIAHLSDPERMFFVTILLNEVLAWMRAQPGTSSLRALLYMDEVYGYLPPTAMPPSKPPLMTLLKQARAFGLGVVLATQNPADLDYKGLSNTGTWLLGRLQTERDKLRVMEGLEGASLQAGAAFDKQQLSEALSRMGKRVFLMNNVHEDAPVVFQSRWALSYLRGPLTRTQIQTLMAPRKAAQQAAQQTTAGGKPAAESIAQEGAQQEVRPLVPHGVEEFFLPASQALGTASRLVYRPALLGRGRLHFIRSTYKTDLWQELSALAPLRDELPDNPWESADRIAGEDLDMAQQPEEKAEFSPLPAPLSRAKTFSSLATQLKDYLYRTQQLSVWRCAQLKEYSQEGETEGDFRIRLATAAREARDLKVEKLRAAYASKLATLKGKLNTALEGVDRETGQFNKASIESMISFGSTIVGALFGRKLASSTNISKAATSMRSIGRAAEQRGDIARAEEKVNAIKQELAELDAQLAADLADAEAASQVDRLELEELTIPPRKSDLKVSDVALVWTPWRVDSTGIAEPAFELPGAVS